MKSLSFTTIQSEVDGLCHNNHDIVTPMSNISIKPFESLTDPDRLSIRDFPLWRGDSGFEMSGTSRSSLLSRISFPPKFWDYLPKKNLRQGRDSIANALLAQSQRGSMVRINGDKVYGVLSPSYERINHDWVIDQLWQNEVPSDFHITDFRADRDCLVLKAMQKSMKNVGDIGVGFVISNSMSGTAALKMRAYVHVLACSNGMILPAGALTQDLHMVHRGPAMPNGLMAPPSTDTPKMEEVANHIYMAIQKARGEDLLKYVSDQILGAKLVDMTPNDATDEEEIFTRVSKMLQLTQDEKTVYVNALARPEHRTMNRWGYVQAATWMAHQSPIEGTQRQEEIEASAWRLLVS